MSRTRLHGMSLSIQALRGLTDSELVAAHDDAAQNTMVGVNYYLDEIHRREQAASMESSAKLARASLQLAAVSAVASLVSIMVAVVAIVLST